MHNTFGPLYRPQDAYIGTLVTFLEALAGGITTVVDNSHNARSAQHSEASIAALFDSGIRGTYAGGRPNSGTWDMQWPQDAYRIKKRYFSSTDQLQSLALYTAPGATVSLEEWYNILRIRKDLDVRLHMDSGLFTKPIKEAYDMGLFYGRETFNHGTALSVEQRRMLIDGGLKVNVCPRIETMFRVGHVPYNEWVEMGLRPGMSNDDPLTYSINMFAEMQTLYAFERARQWRLTPPIPHTSMITLRDVLESATLRNAENCGVDHKAGSLTPGKEADIVLLNADNVGSYPKANAIATVVQGCNIGSVDTVLVAGQVMKWRGKLVDVDLNKIRRMVDSSREYIFAKANWPLDRIDFTD